MARPVSGRLPKNRMRTNRFSHPLRLLAAVPIVAGLAGCMPIAARETHLVGIGPPGAAAPAARPHTRPSLPPGPYDARTDPVTGDPLGRPLAVMIENHPAARPQSGLGEAD